MGLGGKKSVDQDSEKPPLYASDSPDVSATGMPVLTLESLRAEIEDDVAASGADSAYDRTYPSRVPSHMTDANH